MFVREKFDVFPHAITPPDISNRLSHAQVNSLPGVTEIKVKRSQVFFLLAGPGYSPQQIR